MKESSRSSLKITKNREKNKRIHSFVLPRYSNFEAIASKLE